MLMAVHGSEISHETTEEDDCVVPFAKQERMPPWQWRDVRWGMASYITAVHILAVAGLFWVPSCKAATLGWAFILWPISAFGITGGAHRLWSHRSYKANLLYRFIVMIMNSIANQGSIWHWVRDHRVHHLYSETVADPHDAIRGFWFAHIGWLYLKKDPRVIQAGRKLNIDDLRDDGCVMLQKRCDPWWNFFFCFVMPTMVAQFVWGESFLQAFLVAGALRYVWSLHCTWAVNSAAHLWGERPYDPNSNPAQNAIVSLLAIGEGWHNWHHKYPFDYAASEYGGLTEFNPSKAVIDLAARLGMVTNRKRATAMWEREKIKMKEQSKAKAA